MTRNLEQLTKAAQSGGFLHPTGNFIARQQAGGQRFIDMNGTYRERSRRDLLTATALVGGLGRAVLSSPAVYHMLNEQRGKGLPRHAVRVAGGIAEAIDGRFNSLEDAHWGNMKKGHDRATAELGGKVYSASEPALMQVVSDATASTLLHATEDVFGRLSTEDANAALSDSGLVALHGFYVDTPITNLNDLQEADRQAAERIQWAANNDPGFGDRVAAVGQVADYVARRSGLSVPDLAVPVLGSLGEGLDAAAAGVLGLGDEYHRDDYLAFAARQRDAYADPSAGVHEIAAIAEAQLLNLG
jgi:hypothetical protein